MWSINQLKTFFKGELWQNRIAYVVTLTLALLYLISQIAMAILWLAGEAQLDSM